MLFVFKEKKRGGYFKSSRRNCLNLVRKEKSKKMFKMSKEKNDSLQITRYLLDKMGEDKELGWFNLLGDLSDEDVSEYGMSIKQLNGIRVCGNRLDALDRLGW